MRYAVTAHGSILYESDNELIAEAWAKADEAIHKFKRSVCPMFRKGKYTLLCFPGVTMRYQYRIDNQYNSDWPLRYDTGKFGWDNPERFPPYIRNWVQNKITKLETK